MGKRESLDVVLIVLYLSGAVLLLITAYIIYLRKFRRRGKMRMLNNVVLHTSRYDVFQTATQFLLDLPQKSKVKITLLTEKEEPLKTLLEGDLEAGQHPILFNPEPYESGIYFIHLKTDHAEILRRITIDKESKR